MFHLWLPYELRSRVLACGGDASHPPDLPGVGFPTTNVRLTASLDEKDVEEACRALVVRDDMCRQIDILTLTLPAPLFSATSNDPQRSLSF